MPSIDEIAKEYVTRAAALDPFMATCAGIGGHDDELPDLSVDGFAERAGLDRSTLAALDAAEAPALREQIAQAAMRERLALAVERYDAGDTSSELNVAAGWVQDVRELFDLMPTDGEEASANVAHPRKRLNVGTPNASLCQSSCHFRSAAASFRSSPAKSRRRAGRERRHRVGRLPPGMRGARCLLE